MEPPVRLSVIVPVLNESSAAVPALQALAPLRKAGHQVIVVDGGSHDDTVHHCSPLADIMLTSAAGRATQMNLGATHATGDVLWFLHADTLTTPAALTALVDASERAIQSRQAGRFWGRFDVSIVGSHPALWVVARCMNLRSRITGVATGDQGIFIARRLFESVGGYSAIPLMEDVEISKRLRQIHLPLCLKPQVQTSGRRWESRGVIRTILLMWSLRLAYVVGISPQRLQGWYYPASHV